MMPSLVLLLKALRSGRGGKNHKDVVQAPDGVPSESEALIL